MAPLGINRSKQRIWKMIGSLAEAIEQQAKSGTGDDKVVRDLAAEIIGQTWMIERLEIRRKNHGYD